MLKAICALTLVFTKNYSLCPKNMFNWDTSLAAKRHGFDHVFFVLHGLFGKNRTSACDYFTRSGLRFSVQISVLSRIELLRFRLFEGCRDMRVYLFRGRKVFVTEPFLHDFDIHAPLHAVCSERMPQHVQGERERKFLLYLYDFLLNSGERHIKDMFPFAL